jgi:hypothetical protein
MAFKRTLNVYLQLGRSRRYKNDGNMVIISTTTSPPARRAKDSVLVKIKVKVDDEAFDPARTPALIADIPLELLQPAPDEIEVIPEDANE